MNVKSATAAVLKTSTRDAHNSQKTQGSLDAYPLTKRKENDAAPLRCQVEKGQYDNPTTTSSGIPDYLPML